MRSESRLPQFGVLLLLYEMFASIGLGRIPPVTLGTICIQIGLFLKVLSPYLGPWTLWPTSSLCLNANVILNQKQLYRFFTASIFHGSDLHLYYNMVNRYVKPLFSRGYKWDRYKKGLKDRLELEKNSPRLGDFF